MILVRLFFLFIIGLFARRIWRAFKGQARPSYRPGSSEKSKAGNPSDQTKQPNGAISDITEQEIDDADFEEIP
jgi:hypothetical protein